MMQRITNWFRIEYRRAAAFLPRLFCFGIVFAMITGMLLSVFSSILEEKQREDKAKLRIGYVAEEDRMTKLLFSYVAGLDSVDKWCRFVAVTEEEGKDDLQEGKLAALLILPDNVMDEILSGSNAPATLLLPEESNALGIVFEELADAGVRMLSVAQGEIYAVYELVYELGLSKEQLHAMCDAVNAYNINLVLQREAWFRTQKLSVTGSEAWAVYYGSAFMALYGLLCVIVFGRYVKHQEQEQLFIWKRLGISPLVQMAGRTVTVTTLCIAAMLPLVGLWMFPEVRDHLQPMLTWQGAGLVFLAVILLAVYHLMLYQLGEEHRTAVVAVGLFALLQGYLSGYLIPSVLLPERIQGLAFFLPATYIRQAFSVFFSGDTINAGSVCIGLLVFILLLFFLNIVILYWKMSTYGEEKKPPVCIRRKSRCRLRGTVFGIYAKRLCYRKSFWGSLLVILLLSVGLIGMERQSETTITAAFYDESGEWEELLTGYQGYIRFLPCESKERVKELVLRDEVECGYVLPKNLQELVQSGDVKKSILFFKDADAMMANTVNEILFEQLFMELSGEWFVSYIEKNMVQESEQIMTVLEQKMTDGSTFSVQKEYWKTDEKHSVKERKERTTYPVAVIMAAAILLCGMSGIWEAAEDYFRYHFFKRKAFLLIGISVLQPVLCGIAIGILMILYNSY